MGQFGIGIKRSQQTFQEHELIKRGTQEKEQELTLQSYITPQRNGEHKNSKQSQSQTANNSRPQWKELDDWELEMVVGGRPLALQQHKNIPKISILCAANIKVAWLNTDPIPTPW